MSWFGDRFFKHLDPQINTPNQPQIIENRWWGLSWAKMAPKSDLYRFRIGIYSIFIDFDVTFVWYSNDVAIKFRSIFDRLRDAFYNSIRYSCKILPFSVYSIIIPVSSGSMKTTAARGTARGQPPFHASLSYCGSQLNVIPSSVCRRKRSSACDVCLLHLINRTRSLVLEDHLCIMLFDGSAGTSSAHLGPTRPCMPGND